MAEQTVLCKECGQIILAKDAFKHLQETGHNRWELMLPKEDKMKKKVVVDIFGHKAQIEYISGRLGPPGYKIDDQIRVGLLFNEPVGSTAGFGVSLPVKSYTVAEFLEAVRLEGEKRLQAAIEQDQFRREEHKLEKERLDALHEKVEEIKVLIGLE